MNPQYVITDHAAIRWLARIGGVDQKAAVRAVGRAAPNAALAGAMADSYGVPLEALKRALLTPAVAAAIRNRLERVRVGDAVLTIREGRVTSALIADIDVPKTRSLNRREHGRYIRRKARR